MNKDLIIAILAACLVLCLFGWGASVSKHTQTLEATSKAVRVIEWNVEAWKAQTQSEIEASQKREAVLLQEFNDARTRYAALKRNDKSILNEYEITYNAIVSGDAAAIDSLYAIFEARRIAPKDRAR